MTAVETYNNVNNFLNQGETYICELHLTKPRISCINDPASRCSKPSAVKIIDFDSVKKKYCKINGLKSLSSVDGLTFKGERLFFVEIKSIRNFIKHQIKINDTQTEINQKIATQVKHYKLPEKINSSIAICDAINKSSHMIGTIPLVYILLTDEIMSPERQLQWNLNMLAYNAVILPNCTQRYILCRNFDSEMNFY